MTDGLPLIAQGEFPPGPIGCPDLDTSELGEIHREKLSHAKDLNEALVKVMARVFKEGTNKTWKGESGVMAEVCAPKLIFPHYSINPHMPLTLFFLLSLDERNPASGQATGCQQ